MPAPDDPIIHVHSQSQGRLQPMSHRELSQKLQDGSLSQEDLVWFSGMDRWRPLAEFPPIEDTPRPEAEAPAAAEAVAGISTDIEATRVQDGALPEADTGTAEDDRLEDIFGTLVEQSWDFHHQHNFASHIDEVVVGAIITSFLESGRSLIDLTSDGTHHYMRFDKLKDQSQIIVRLTHLTGDLTTATVQGHRVSVVVGYGERIRNFKKIWQALKAEYKSGLISRDAPGSISVDGDLASQYVYVQVRLYLKIDDCIDHEYDIHYGRLGEHLGAAVHALRKYLRGRFAS